MGDVGSCCQQKQEIEMEISLVSLEYAFSYVFRGELSALNNQG